MTLQEINRSLVDNRVDPLNSHELAMISSMINRTRFCTTIATITGKPGANREAAIAYLDRLVNAARMSIRNGAPVPPSIWGASATTTPHAASFKPPTNLREANDFFAAHALPKLDYAGLSTLYSTYGRNETLRLMTLIGAGGQIGAEAADTLRGMLIDAGSPRARMAQPVPSPASVTPISGVRAQDDIPADPEIDDEPHSPAHGSRSNQGSRPTVTATSRPLPRDTTGTDRQAPKDRFQARAYGGSAALCVEASESQGGNPTVRFELAPATAKNSKTYQWENKLIVQLTADELPQLLAVLFRFAVGVRFANHGPTKSKWLSLENQDGGLFIKAGDKDVRVLAIPVSTADALVSITDVALGVAHKKYPHLSGEDLKLIVRAQVAPRVKAPAPAPAG
ncbi:hypothetical protein B1A_01603 [mine drainage metagenome]|uniref:Uncharacterized protein n=2 Tax=mine drainage metagenome TaxID=410659 RepID=T1CDU9_9ZZZZ